MVKDINVVILGGCGFLGQHVISELLDEKEKMKTDKENEGNDNGRWRIKDIRVLDVKPFSEECFTNLRKDCKTVDYQQCDIRDISKLTEKLKGATAVINCVAITPNFEREDMGFGETMNQVNITGTKNVVKTCQEVGIQALIHTSDYAVVMGDKLILEHTEPQTPEVTEDSLIFGDYARGRIKAEKIVLDAHETKSKDGVILRTVVLRPGLLYGEGDHSYVPLFHKLAKANGKKIPSLGHPDSFIQMVYAGNAAVAHICALKHLINYEELPKLHLCGGLPAYVTDDSPPGNVAASTEPFLRHLRYAPPKRVWYYVTSLKLYWAHLSHSFKSMMGLKSEETEESLLPTFALHKFCGWFIVVSRVRAEIGMGYSPPYSWEQALKRSNTYYSRKLR